MKYPETKQTLDALLNVQADKDFVSFDRIYKEVKKIRLSKGLKEETKNLKGRVRRSLINDSITGMVRKTEQSEKLSIMANFPYSVQSKTPIAINEKELANIKDVEGNSYFLKKESI
jgi:hypothetical protein